MSGFPQHITRYTVPVGNISQDVSVPDKKGLKDNVGIISCHTP